LCGGRPFKTAAVRWSRHGRGIQSKPRRYRRTGWLGRQDSNLCIPDRSSPRLSARGGRIREGCRVVAQTKSQGMTNTVDLIQNERFESCRPQADSLSLTHTESGRARNAAKWGPPKYHLCPGRTRGASRELAANISGLVDFVCAKSVGKKLFPVVREPSLNGNLSCSWRPTK